MTSTHRELLKKIPGARGFYRSFLHTPGSWIFSAGNTHWLLDEEVVNALPPLYRGFARYCSLAPTRRGRVLGAELVHSLASTLTRILGAGDEVCIHVDDLDVHVLLSDPRSLVIPGELRGSAEVALLRELIRPGDTFVDVGANHGSFSIVASSVVGADGLVVAFEPQPRLAGLVQKSLAANGCSRFAVHNVACSDEAGVAEFFVPRATSGSAGLYRGFSAISAATRLRVSLVRLDDALDWTAFPGRCVVKIDVEGAELKVLRGAGAMLRHHRPPLIMEINPNAMTAAGTHVEDLLGVLQTAGYEVFREVGGEAQAPLRTLGTRQRNVVFLPAEA